MDITNFLNWQAIRDFAARGTDDSPTSDVILHLELPRKVFAHGYMALWKVRRLEVKEASFVLFYREKIVLVCVYCYRDTRPMSAESMRSHLFANIRISKWTRPNTVSHLYLASYQLVAKVYLDTMNAYLDQEPNVNEKDTEDDAQLQMVLQESEAANEDLVARVERMFVSKVVDDEKVKDKEREKGKCMIYSDEIFNA